MLRVIAELGEPWRSAPSRQDFNELPARGAGVTVVELKRELRVFIFTLDVWSGVERLLAVVWYRLV